MSDNSYWQDDDEVTESNAMRVLREKAEADSKVIREMAERLRKMEEAEQRRNLESTLNAKGLDPKVAELIPADANPEEWLTTYGNLFGAASTASQEEAPVTDDGVPADEAAALAAMGTVASGAQPKAGLNSVEAQILAATNEEDLLRFLHSQS